MNEDAMNDRDICVSIGKIEERVPDNNQRYRLERGRKKAHAAGRL